MKTHNPKSEIPFPILVQFGVKKLVLITEPSADRGPQRGSPAGVVDAPDAVVILGDENSQAQGFTESLVSCKEVAESI